jgi:hypothetical protein
VVLGFLVDLVGISLGSYQNVGVDGILGVNLNENTSKIFFSAYLQIYVAFHLV